MRLATPGIKMLLIALFLLPGTRAFSQEDTFPDLPFEDQLSAKEKEVFLTYYRFLNLSIQSLWEGQITLVKSSLDQIEEAKIKNTINNAEAVRYLLLNKKLYYGYYNREILKLQKAESNFRQVLNTLDSLEVLNKEEESIRLQTIASLIELYSSRGNYQSALDIFKQAEDSLGTIYAISTRASLYRQMHERDSAEVYYNRLNQHVQEEIASGESLDTNIIIACLHGIAAFKTENKEFDAALGILEIALQLEARTDLANFAKTCFRMGQTHAALNNFGEALKHLRKSYQIEKALLKTNKHPNYSRIELALADIFQKQHLLDSALYHYQHALISLTEGFHSGDPGDNPDLHSTEYKRQLLTALGKKAACLYSRNQDSDLNHAYRAIENAVQLIDSIRADYTEDFDKLFLLQQSYQIFETGIYLAIRKNENNQAFEWSEKSKAILLYEAVKNSYAEKYGNIPEEELERERLLRYEITKYSNFRRHSSNSRKRKELELKRVQLKEKHQQLIREFEQKYPEYHQLKYDLRVPAPKQIIEEILAPDQSLLEYFVGTDSIVIFLIDKDHEIPEVVVVPKHQQFEEQAAAIGRSIDSLKANSFTPMLYRLYQQLFQKVLTKTNSRRLIIIPDGIMGYIPFSALLTEEVAPENYGDFRIYPFIIRKHALSQCFSASVLLQMYRQRSKRYWRPKIKAWAPDFSDTSSLLPLEYSKNEILAIEKIWKHTQSTFGAEATRNSFIQASEEQDFQILHIASHAEVLDREPNYSYIAFSNIDHPGEADYKLYVSDLYDLILPLEMVVLSACKTGSGKLDKGEGIISISRAFTYARAKSILTSLWNINDEANAKLMEAFYRELKNKHPKDIALQLAQNEMLEGSIQKANPKYWAAFAPIGNMEPLTPNIPWFMYILAGGLPVMLLVLFFILKKKKQTKPLAGDSIQ